MKCSIEVDYLYDCNLAIADIDGHSPGFRELINGIPVDAKLYIRRIPLSNVPLGDEKECAKFLHKLYQEKVRFLCLNNRTLEYQ